MVKKIEKPIPHPQIAGVKLVGDIDIFPISWLHKQEYCEYQIYLENVKAIQVEPTKPMLEGKLEHERLELEFKEKAVPATFDEMLKKSKMMHVVSREFPVISLKYGIHGLIDEIHLTPKEFVIIDDKPGTKMFLSNIHQVYGYCLAFQDTIKQQDYRQITAALRERGTDNIYWRALFDEKAVNDIVNVINHIHRLISGKEQFNSCTNPNKCKPCRFKNDCDRVMWG